MIIEEIEDDLIYNLFVLTVSNFCQVLKNN